PFCGRIIFPLFFLPPSLFLGAGYAAVFRARRCNTVPFAARQAVRFVGTMRYRWSCANGVGWARAREWCGVVHTRSSRATGTRRAMRTPSSSLLVSGAMWLCGRNGVVAQAGWAHAENEGAGAECCIPIYRGVSCGPGGAACAAVSLQYVRASLVIGPRAVSASLDGSERRFVRCAWYTCVSEAASQSAWMARAIVLMLLGSTSAHILRRPQVYTMLSLRPPYVAHSLFRLIRYSVSHSFIPVFGLTVSDIMTLDLTDPMARFSDMALKQQQLAQLIDHHDLPLVQSSARIALLQCVLVELLQCVLVELLQSLQYSIRLVLRATFCPTHPFPAVLARPIRPPHPTSNHHLLPILLGTLPLFFLLVLFAAFVLYRRRRAWEDTVRARALTPDEEYYWVPAQSSASGAGSWRRRSAVTGHAASTGAGTSAHSASSSWQRLGSVPPSPTPARTGTGMTWNGSDVLVLGPLPDAGAGAGTGADEKAPQTQSRADEKARARYGSPVPSTSPPGLEGFANNVDVEQQSAEKEKRRNEVTSSAKSDVDVDLTLSDADHAGADGDRADASTEATYGTAYSEYSDKSAAAHGHGHGHAHGTGAPQNQNPRPHPYAYASSSDGDSFDTASSYSTHEHDGDYDTHTHTHTRPSALLAQALLRLSRSPTFVTFESRGYSEPDSRRTPPTPPPHYSRPLPRIPVPVPPLPRPPSFSSS
ncbi:hypothetical protein B0H16DRAFT_1849140, partial [Mycena metata]